MTGVVRNPGEVHFLRDALDHLPRKADDERMTELGWIYARRTVEEARQHLGAWLKKWGHRYQKLCAWVEATLDEALRFHSLPRQHHKHLKSTSLQAQLNEEIKRRTQAAKILPRTASCRRAERALAVEMPENRIDGTRYLNMKDLGEHKKEQLREAAAGNSRLTNVNVLPPGRPSRIARGW